MKVVKENREALREELLPDVPSGVVGCERGRGSMCVSDAHTACTARRVHSATRTQHDAYTAHPNAARTFHAVVADVKGGANVEGGAVAAAPLDKAVIDGHRLHKAAHCRRRSGSGDGGARGLVGWLRRGQVLARETRRRNEGLIIVHRLRSSERSWGV